MNPAPHAISAAAPLPAATLVEAPRPTSTAEFERAAAALADRAAVFARTSPRAKSALLRAAIPRILALAPEMVALDCRAAGIDSASPLGGAAWLSGPIALLAGARAFAGALDDIAANGRPALPAGDLRGRRDGRVVARLEPRSFAERSRHRGTEAVAVFAAGVEPEDVIAGQAFAYRLSEPPAGVARVVAAGGPASAAPLRVLEALFVEGKVTLLETSPERAWLGPLVERGLAPLIEAGFLGVVHGGDTHLASMLGSGEPIVVADGGGGPVVVVPALYARDELWFIARRLASEIAAGAAFGIAAPRLVILAGCWAQRRLFVENLERALAALPSRGTPWTVIPDLAPDADPPAGVIGLLDAGGGDDPVEMLSAAVDRCNGRSGTAASAEIVVHVIHEEDVEIAAAIDRAAVRLRCGAVGINQWPALLAFRGEPAARMLAQVDKTIVWGPLRTAQRPAYFYDNPRAAQLGARLAAFEAAPSFWRR